MLMFLYLCTGFAISTALVSLAHVVAFAWHGVRIRMESGASGNVRGTQLKEMVIGWVVLGFSIYVIIMLSAMYP
jgi:hypothetical protein